MPRPYKRRAGLKAPPTTWTKRAKPPAELAARVEGAAERLVSELMRRNGELHEALERAGKVMDVLGRTVAVKCEDLSAVLRN